MKNIADADATDSDYPDCMVLECQGEVAGQKPSSPLTLHSQAEDICCLSIQEGLLCGIGPIR